MKKLILILLFTLAPLPSLLAAEGMIDVKSHNTAALTADRLEAILKEKGMTIFQRIKHSESAAKVGVALNPTELIIFGNPKVGSPLMQCRQTVALDLPQKALIWRDDGGDVWLSYNDPAYLVRRHEISGCEQVIAKITKALAAISGAAAAKP